MSGPLSGLRILDLSWVLSGPYCTMTLCDLGAEVIKCERPPYGDHARNTGPVVDGESGYFFSVNRGKRSISIDLRAEEGRELFLRLVDEVDVVVENFTPGTMEQLGLGYETLSEANPRLIYCAVSGFGHTGPLSDRPALDIIVQGMGGIMSITGEPGGGPIRPGVSLGDIAAGLYAAIGILAAVYERERSGRGQFVDVSMLDSQVAIQENAFMRYHVSGQTPSKLGTRHPTAVPFQAFETADGYMVIALSWGVPNQWALLCAELGIIELADDPRFATGEARSEHHGELEPLLTEAFRTRSTREWVERLEPYDIPCGPLNSIPDVTRMPQLAAREMLVPVEHHTLGALPLVNTPVKLSRTPGGISSSSPDMGQHTREVLDELLGIDGETVDELLARGVVRDRREPPELG